VASVLRKAVQPVRILPAPHRAVKAGAFRASVFTAEAAQWYRHARDQVLYPLRIPFQSAHNLRIDVVARKHLDRGVGQRRLPLGDVALGAKIGVEEMTSRS